MSLFEERRYSIEQVLGKDSKDKSNESDNTPKESLKSLYHPISYV